MDRCEYYYYRLDNYHEVIIFYAETLNGFFSNNGYSIMAKKSVQRNNDNFK